jgi:glutamyl-tRNA synthetase
VLHKNGVRVRFAPSPTGHLHIGGMRSALFNWLFARHNGGVFLVRIEDTDLVRSSPEYVASIMNSIKWMGLTVDEPIVYQLARVKEHQQAADDLMKKGFAYPCFCEPKEADTVIFELEQGRGSKYQGTCRDRPYTEKDLLREHAIRFRVPDGLSTVNFNDVILGNVSVGADQLDDFVIIRRDGIPTYNFCVVVDDIFMRITHVIRGQDHVSNTSKQMLFYKALGATPPLFAHIPLILGNDGSKLSKRDASVAVQEYCQQGFLPEALFNYLVRLGWSHSDQEIFTQQELINDFTLEAVGKKGAIFDIKKLQWLNGHYLRMTTVDQLSMAINTMDACAYERLCLLWPPKTLDLLLDLYKQRATTLRDIVDGIEALANDLAVLNIEMLDKWKSPKMLPLLMLFVETIEKSELFTHDVLSHIAKSVCEQHAEKLVTLAQPLRYALTGSVVSPGVFELLEILGKQRSLNRINRLLILLK